MNGPLLDDLHDQLRGEPTRRLAEYLDVSRDVATAATDVALRVIEEAQTYPELGQREKAWVSPAEAAARVDEPELKALLAGFSP